MAQQHPPYPQRVYSPLQRTDSPQSSPFPQDPKRAAFSPTAQSPYGSPGPSNITLPNQVFSTPYYNVQTNGTPPPPSTYNAHGAYTPYTTMNSHPPTPTTASLVQQNPPAGTMGPPSRPSDKPTDINDLGDVLSGSGIDLKEEEAAMYNSYGNQQYISRPQQEPAPHFPRPYPFPRDNYYAQNVPGDRRSFYGAGTFNQPPQPYRSAEAIAETEKKKAIRRRNEIKQYHLNQPFLQTGNLRRRLETERLRNHVHFDDSGLWAPRLNMPPRECHVVGPDGNEVVRVLQNEEILRKDTALGEILALISLATEERLRGVVEDAAALARQRKVPTLGLESRDATHGLETQERETANGLPTPSNSAVSPKANSLKRSYSEANKPLTPVSNKSHVDPFSPPMNRSAQALLEIAKKERELEVERMAKRQKRKAAAAGDASSVEVGSGPGTPGSLGDVAPEVRKMAPKKAKAQADNASQAQHLAALNKTTQMALGGKQLSWMKKGPDSGPSNPYLARANTTSQKSGGTNAEGANQVPKVRPLGEYREGKEGEKAFLLRDVFAALEEDGREKRALQKAYGLLLA